MSTIAGISRGRARLAERADLPHAARQDAGADQCAAGLGAHARDRRAGHEDRDRRRRHRPDASVLRADRSFVSRRGFPKGQTAYTTPKVIVARAFAPATPVYRNSRTLPFDPELSDHGTHVAGIAAGDNNTPTRTGVRLSGIAPRAYLGSDKALGIPSQFGANGNSPELAAAVEAAVRDGMDVINLCSEKRRSIRAATPWSMRSMRLRTPALLRPFRQATTSINTATGRSRHRRTQRR